MWKVVAPVSEREPADYLLFGVTSVELGILVALAPTFTIVDCVYVVQHLMVLGIALTRCRPGVRDDSFGSNLAVVVAYGYPYAQMAYLRWVPGDAAWPAGGLVLVTLAACLSLSSLFCLGRRFGIRPALRGLETRGPYRLVRHPIYLAYVLGDIGYNLQEWNAGTVILVLAGWLSLLYRIKAEERTLSYDPGWMTYTTKVPRRLVPGLW